MVKRKDEPLRTPRTRFKAKTLKKQPCFRLAPQACDAVKVAAKIPFEIIEKIFIQAACDPSLRSLTLVLMRVSQWVHDLVQPYLYHSIQLKIKLQAEHFLYTITRRPELCRYIAVFSAPEVTIPCVTYWWWQKRRNLPAFCTMANIVDILLHSGADKAGQLQTQSQNGVENYSHLPLASNLESVIIDSQYFEPKWLTLPKRDKALQNFILPPIVTLTSFYPFTISKLGVWDCTRIRKLRFTCMFASPDLYIRQLFSLPELTHFALPLGCFISKSTKLLLTSPRIQKLAVFTEYGPNSTIIPRRISRVSHYISILDSLRHTARNEELSNRIWADSERLGSIVDNRLFLFDYAEMERVCEMSNEAFWDSIDQL